MVVAINDDKINSNNNNDNNNQANIKVNSLCFDIIVTPFSRQIEK